MKLEVTNSLVIFIVIVYYVSWFISLPSWWIPLGELLCHFNLPLVSSPVLLPLNSHTCIYSKGYMLRYMLSVENVLDLTCILSYFSQFSQTPMTLIVFFFIFSPFFRYVRSFSFPDLLNCVPSEIFLL